LDCQLSPQPNFAVSFGMPQPVLGKRVRFFRREAGLTLDAVGTAVGRPASYLSQLENGLNDPRASLIEKLADVLGCTQEDLTDTEPPTYRDDLEIKVESYQREPRYAELHLPHLKPTARTPDEVLEHIARLYESLRDAEAAAAVRPGDDQREAQNRIRDDMRDRNNYFADIEAEAQRVLDAVGYTTGPMTERVMTDLAGHYGFSVERIQDLPLSTRSITDQRARKIYIAQRNDITTRAARSVILQTLGHFVLGHRDSDDFGEYVRQRVEANYFAGAVLAPEKNAVAFLQEAYDRCDISVEDFREVFYISYEMAAHRLTNLATEHFDVRLHFLRSDREGLIWKAYHNNDVPLPADADGTVEGQRLCRAWGSRQVFESKSAYDLYYQWTETPAGDYWCVTYIEPDRSPPYAVTLGTNAADAKYFRGRDTPNRMVSRCPAPSCCREPNKTLSQRWRGAAWPSAKDRSQVLSGLPADRPSFSKFPGVDLVDVYDFLERQSRS
jgi:predicted transcriptional regulator/DNA-binding XRE family transcriptional regulator